ncbi:grainyhead-like [Linnemannia schmuckeri]|uniref:Grainyhead-like n=1 Tax=Linnemannia schmuckeri TaxID=64567 RepID=A0A9P5S881_9FUNG|nr:grainyhead-like [Linnemannia schmuckeri]
MSSSLDHQGTHYGLNNNNPGNNNNNNGGNNNNNSNSNNGSNNNNAIDNSGNSNINSNNSNSNSNNNGGGGGGNNGNYHLGYQPQQQQQRHPQHQHQQQQFHQQQQQHDYHQQNNMHQQRSSNQQNQQQQRHPNQYGQQQQQNQQQMQRPPSPYGSIGSQQQQNNSNNNNSNNNNNDNNYNNNNNNYNNNNYGNNNNNNNSMSRQNNSQQQQQNQGDYMFRGNQQQFDNYGQGSHQSQDHYQNQGQQQQQHQQQHQQQNQQQNQQQHQQQQQQHQHQQHQQQQGRSHDSAEQGSASVSVSDSSPPRSENESNLRFKITLEAQTAAMQRQDETPVTYLNKGQFYTVVLEDTEEYDGDITSVIKVTFHDASHRRLAARYWSFWLSQQSNPKIARALDIEKASSSGMMEVQSKTFDRISFKWNGKAGAKLMVRFNCLSTDFSRIKGVKGIPLRVHVDTMTEDDNNGGEHSMERSFAKIKLFRDKGAERKNKDDHKHLEKMWDKMRGKNADTNPLVNMLAPVQSVSLFSECMDHPEGSGEDETLDLSETLAHDPEGDVDGSGGGGGEDGATTSGASSRQDSEVNRYSPGGSGGNNIPGCGGAESNSLVPVTKKRRRGTDNAGSGNSSNSNNFDQQYSHQQQQQQNHVGYLNSSSSPSNGSVGFPGGSNNSNGNNNSTNNNNSSSGSMMMTMSSDLFLDRDPSYVPQTRKKRPVLCLYIKIGGESVYRAVYLEKYTLTDLIQKLSEKLEIQSSTISCVYRKTTKKELMVRVDDSMVAQMTDELDMVVDYDFNQMDGSVNLTLKY